jgi:nucleotide-binding universal stress UspA family protein
VLENVLVPHDLTDLSDAGFDALQRLGTRARHLHVVHVLPRIDLTTPTMVWSRDEDEARVAHARGALRTRLQGTPWELAVLHVQVGDPASRIVEIAREIGADLIAMASHGRTGMERFVLGSVAEHVARFAACPVLVVPARAAAVVTSEGPSLSDVSRAEQIDALAVELARRVGQDRGWLAAARIALPEGEDREQWDGALERRLAELGIEFVDVVFTPGSGPRARILSTTFEERMY